MKNQSIVIASVLKPVDEPRMLNRMAKSLTKAGFKVILIGFGSLPSSNPEGIHFHGLGHFNRLSIKRLFVPWRILAFLFKSKPSQVVINTHELLLPAILYKAFTGKRIIYDVRENYYLNLRHIKAFPVEIRALLAGIVRLIETCSAPFINHFILAEKIYAEQLPFVRDRFTVIENKCQLPRDFKRAQKNDNEIRLLFSGTLDESTGVFQAIELTKQLRKIDHRVQLHIIGFCSLETVQQKILNITHDCDYIALNGITKHVNHASILSAIAHADAGIIFYPPSHHTDKRIPTKLYEYLACELPILFDKNVSWKELVDKHEAGIPIDFNQPDYSLILQLITSRTFYRSHPHLAHWESEEQALLSVVQ